MKEAGIEQVTWKPTFVQYPATVKIDDIWYPGKVRIDRTVWDELMAGPPKGK